MKRFIKIETSSWIEPGKKMLYEDEYGKTFVGHRFNILMAKQ